MAETLTFQSTQETTSAENLNADEQDSLKVGEEMQEAQDKRLAGKYENAEELEKAYIELEKKLGQQDTKEETAPPLEAEATTEEEKVEETPDSTSTLLEDLWQQATEGEGKYNKETLEALEKADPKEIAKMHLDYRASTGPRDFTDQDVKELKDIAGGEKEYGDMLDWAQKSLNKKEIDMFDAVMEKGDPLAAFFAVRSLAYRYHDANGVEGRTLTGTAPKSSGDIFKSQAEVVAAMGDPRYDRDPAYRRSIMEKLERSPEVKF